MASLVNKDTMWLVVPEQTSSAASRGVLLRTEDGGANWTSARLPALGSVTIVTSTDAWLAGGPAGDALYVTHDAGATWSRQSLPGAPAGSEHRATATAPTFFDASAGVLAVQISNPTSGASLRFFGTSDGGTTWQASGPPLNVNKSGEIVSGAFSLVSYVSPTTWYVMGDSLMLTEDGGKSFTPVAGNRDLRNMAGIEFKTRNEGWVLVSDSSCGATRQSTKSPGPRSACGAESHLLTTTDGGHSWTERPVG